RTDHEQRTAGAMGNRRCGEHRARSGAQHRDDPGGAAGPGGRMSRSEPCQVVIASYLEPELVERIVAGEPRAQVLYEPSLLPPPRYPSDHHGDPRDLD